MTSPYDNLHASAFWRNAVAERDALDPGELYARRFAISKRSAIVTAGSCFAQHIGRNLRAAGCNVIDAEPGPRGVPHESLGKFGYGMYSARYGNIYTIRQLVQLLDEAEGEFVPAEPIWIKDGRYYDALRPNVEPIGLESADSVRRHRAVHLAKVMQAFSAADIFVFTFGLTESWIHTETGTVYPTAPGVIAGEFDPARFSFRNFNFLEILRDFKAFRKRMMAIRRNIRFVVTVSPVPLTATASGKHVEVATVYSKSVLRAVCGELSDTLPNVDYFPSYEIITSTNNRGIYYEANKRSVSRAGVRTAMSMFLGAHNLDRKVATPAADDAATAAQGAGADRRGPAARSGPATDEEAEIVCEEAMIEAARK